jgi:hypothetical protein
MWSVFSQLLAPAMVVAISPFSIIVAVFLVLHTDRARSNGLAFLAGRIVALAAATVAVLQTPRLIGGLNRPASPWTLIGIGAVLLLSGVAVWVKRDQMAEEPRWLSRVDRLTPIGAAVIGMLLVVTNPKMLAATAAAGLLIGAGGLGVAGASGAVVYYSAMASSTVAVPVIAYAAVGTRADVRLTQLKNWLHHHNGHVSAVVLLAVGIALLLTGIAEF